MVSITSPVTPPSGSVNWLARVRIPLAATAAVLVAIDCIGLGLHLADENRDAIAGSQAAARAQARVTAPDAVVDSGGVASGTAGSTSRRTRTTTATGVLIGPVAPPVITNPAQPGSKTGSTPTSPSTPSNPSPTPPAVPLAQADVAVPGLGVQASLGLGDNSCTTVNLTLLALGDCPAPEGDGAVILQLGGSLLGG